MGKMTTFVIIFAGLSILFYITGILGSNIWLDVLLEPESMSTGAFYGAVIAAVGVGVAVIAIGFLTKNIELAAMAGFIAFLLPFLLNIFDVYNEMAAANRVIAVLLFAPLLFMFIMTIVDYWRGRD